MSINMPRALADAVEKLNAGIDSMSNRMDAMRKDANESEHFDQGRKAARVGRKRHENPFKEGTIAASDWARGFNKGQRELEDGQRKDAAGAGARFTKANHEQSKQGVAKAEAEVKTAPHGSQNAARRKDLEEARAWLAKVEKSVTQSGYKDAAERGDASKEVHEFEASNAKKTAQKAMEGGDRKLAAKWVDYGTSHAKQAKDKAEKMEGPPEDKKKGDAVSMQKRVAGNMKSWEVSYTSKTGEKKTTRVQAETRGEIETTLRQRGASDIVIK
jgi:hypothetical protein